MKNPDQCPPGNGQVPLGCHFEGNELALASALAVTKGRGEEWSQGWRGRPDMGSFGSSAQGQWGGMSRFQINRDMLFSDMPRCVC